MYRQFLIVALAVTVSSCSDKVPRSEADNDTSQQLNLSFERSTTTGEPAEWFVVPQRGYRPYVSDPGVAFAGENCLYFRSEVRDTTQRVVCYSSLLSDVVQRNLEISCMVKAGSSESLRYGIYYYAHGSGNVQPPVLVNLPAPGSTDWQRQTINIPRDKLPGDILDFGLWISGTGELWLDDWQVTVDGKPYNTAVQKRVPPISAPDLASMKEAIIQLPDGAPAGWAHEPSWLDDAIGDADVVLLGEATHGTKEFTDLRTGLTEYLIKELNFTTVALEAPLPEVDRFNDLLYQGEGLSFLQQHIAEDLHFWMYRTSEYLSFLEWLQAKEPGTIELRGIDMQSYQYALDAVAAEVAALKNDALLHTVDSLRSYIGRPEKALPLAKRLHRGLSALASDRSGHQQTVRYAAIIQDALAWGYSSVTPSFRDSCMAENVRWLQRRSPTDKVVVWAHNGHVRSTGNAMGGRLHEMDSLKVFSIGVAAGGGMYRAKNRLTGELAQDLMKPASPESWEYYFAQLGTPNFFLDLRKAAPTIGQYASRRSRAVGAIATPHQFRPADLANQFDALIYLDQTSPAIAY